MSTLVRRVSHVVVMRCAACGRRGASALRGVVRPGTSRTRARSGRRGARRGVVLLVLTVGAWLALGGGSALAKLQWPYLSQLTGTPSGSFLRVWPVTTDPSGDVYVADGNNQVVDVFSPSGAYLSQFNGSATPAGFFDPTGGLAVAPASGDVYAADRRNGVVDVFGSSGAYLSQFSGSATPAGSFSPTAVAVDPASGNVYVADGGNGVVDVFSSSGTYVSQLVGSATPQGSFSPLGIAVSAASGDVYVADSNNRVVDVFSSSGAYLSQFDGGATPAGSFGVGRSGMAIDQSNGRVYVTDQSNSVVDAFDSSGSYLGQFDFSATPQPRVTLQGVAVDQSGNVYVADSNSDVVDKFGPAVILPDVTTGQASAVTTTGATLNGTVNPDATTITGCRFDYVDDADYNPSAANPYAPGETAPCSSTPSGSSAVPVSANVASLTPGVLYHFRLEAGNANGTSFGSDQTFATGGVIDGESAANVSSDAANLRAQINPEGVDTTYHLEYGPTTGYGTSVPVPDADISSGTTDVAVTQHVQGLAAGTAYHYRAVAINAAGTVDGPDHTFTTQPAGSGSGGLPDGRAYEQVTPADKGDGGLSVQAGGQASPDGNAFSFRTIQPFPGTQSGTGGVYLASRDSGGWSSLDLIPPQAPTNNFIQIPQIAGFSTDLSKAVLEDGGGASGATLGQDSPPLVPGEPANTANLFLRNNLDNSYQLVDVPPAGVTLNCKTGGDSGCIRFEGGPPDLSHVLFDSDQQLTPDAITGPGIVNLFQWIGGNVNLVDLIPPAGATSCGGTGPACIASPNGGESGEGTNGQFGMGATVNVVSPDGSEVFFTTYDTQHNQRHGQLFVRENGTRTIEISASHKTNGTGPGGTDPNGPLAPTWWPASADGTKAFFTSCEQLTNDSTAVDIGPSNCFFGRGGDLYEYDLASGSLTDLTVDQNPADAAGADMLGVAGASSDGSYVYFVAAGSLAPGATPGKPNLYLSHDRAAPRFIATLDPADSRDWEANTTARVTPDGTRLAFMSVRSPTGYDNTDAVTGQPDSEVFLYDASTGQLSCASCNPTGGQPVGPSSIPGGGSFYLSRALSADGSRLFFDSSDALVPGDTNGKQDVYEYENGRPYLISTGTSSADSTFFDASPSGSDVFFATDQPLVPSDTDTAFDVYDARVGGGFPAAAPPAAPCTGEECKPPASGAPPAPPAASVSFTGPGNPAGGSSPAGAGKVKLLRKLVRGSAIVLIVAVPAPGRITVSGRDLKTLRRSVGAAGSYRLTTRLTAAGRRALKRKRRMRVTLRVAYARAGGGLSSTTVTFTVKA